MFSMTSITILSLGSTILTEIEGLCESDICSNLNKNFSLYIMLLGLFDIKLLPINNVKVILYMMIQFLSIYSSYLKIAYTYKTVLICSKIVSLKSDMAIGVIGVGMLGTGIIERLIELGTNVNVYGRNKAKLAYFQDKGAKIFSDARTLAEQSDLIITCVTN